MPDETKPLTTADAGRLGGNATKAKHGPEFYRKIGAKGGERVRTLIAAARAREVADREKQATSNAS